MNNLTVWRNAGCTVAPWIALIFGLLLSADSSAQQFIFQQPAGKDRDTALYEQYMLQLDQKKQAAEHRMEFYLADIDRACQLTESQRKKLAVASKGAVEAFVGKATDEIKKTARQVGFDFEPGTPPEKADDADVTEEQGNGLQAQGVFVMNAIGGMEPGSDTVEQEKIWQLSVKKVLTKEQDEKLQSWVGQRQRLLEKAAVDSFVARVDQELLLSTEQREKLTQWLGETYAKQLAKKSGAQLQGFVVMNGGLAEPPVIKGPVAAILTEAQGKVWATSFQNELDGLNQFQGNVRGAVPAIRMLPAARIQVDDNN